MTIDSIVADNVALTAKNYKLIQEKEILKRQVADLIAAIEVASNTINNILDIK